MTEQYSSVTATLLPCPFCGAPALMTRFESGAMHTTQIQCGNDEDCPVCVDVQQSAEDVAIKVWNTRASQPATPTAMAQSSAASATPTNRQLHDAIADAISRGRTYSGIQEAVREIQKLYGDAAQGKIDPATVEACAKIAESSAVTRNGTKIGIGIATKIRALAMTSTERGGT